MALSFYSAQGLAIAYLDNDGESIYLFDGTPVAWICGTSIYAYSGKHIGYYIHAWIIDHRGNRVFFTDDSQGGPSKPTLINEPVRAVKKAKPARGEREKKPARPTLTHIWSSLSGEKFFR